MDRFIDLPTAVMRAIGGLTRPMTRHITYTTRSGIAAGLKRKGGLGFLPRAVSDEERFYLRLDLTGKVVYDIGSYEGIFSMFAARAVGDAGTLVVCEPNPWCFQNTRCNLELNHFACKIVMENAALGEARSTMKMVQPRLEPARSTINNDIADRIKGSEEFLTFETRVERLDDLIAERGWPPPAFIKVDTEGVELAVLKGATNTLAAHQPELLIEMDGTTPENWAANFRAIHQFVSGLGYGVWDLYGKKLSQTDSADYIHCTAQQPV
ncbi:MAG TPA: FkbM family methyltransferase [Candidatus Bathyarchaeia archaeon]|nr:FkbM family methyltransferase [Candidatus Bathyarchaeia archaeon]